jgi:cytochrome c peroxidase
MSNKKGLLWVLFCAVMILITASLAIAADGPAAGLSAKEQLGKSIFFDDNLSINQNQACAACHGPEVGFTGPISATNAHGAVYEGSIAGEFGDRKPPSAAYATSSPILHFVIEKREALFIGGNFWNGRATGELLGNPAADQALGPFLNPVEQALPDKACVVYRVCEAADYPVSFDDVWGTEASCDITWPADVEETCSTLDATVSLSPSDRVKVDQNYDLIGLTIAAYEASSEVNQFSSKFDYYQMGMADLTREERKGFNLFRGKAKCSSCHVLDPGPNGEPPLFTDFTFDNLGVPANPENPVYDVNPNFVDLGLGGFLADRQDYEEYAEDNDGKQKVPTLRNVDKRPDEDFVKSFAHNGYFKSLEEIVHFYNTRDILPTCMEGDGLVEKVDCWPPPEVAENVNTSELGNLHLTESQEAFLVAFMKTLSDGWTPSP